MTLGPRKVLLPSLLTTLSLPSSDGGFVAARGVPAGVLVSVAQEEEEAKLGCSVGLNSLDDFWMLASAPGGWVSLSMHKRRSLGGDIWNTLSSSVGVTSLVVSLALVSLLVSTWLGLTSLVSSSGNKKNGELG
jgi:hypothetical protein